MKKIFIVVLSIVFIGVVITLGWLLFFKPKKLKQMRPRAAIVSVKSVKSINKPIAIQAVGTLIPAQKVNLCAEVSGYVAKINFDSGKYVKKGDLIVQLDDTQAKADFLSKKTAYHFAKLKYERAKKLLKYHDVSQQDVDALQSDEQDKKAALSMEQDQLNKMSIRAPFAGYLGKKTVNIGDYIKAGQTIVRLVDRHHLKVEYAIPEKYLSRVHLKQTVDLTSNAYPKLAFKASVSFISPAIDPDTHMITMQADVDNTKDLLAPGLFVQVRQILQTKNDVLIVPEQSLVKTLDKTIVYRVINHKAVATTVTTAGSKRGMVEVLSGLAKNDVIVVAGQHDLKDGQAVTIK